MFYIIKYYYLLMFILYNKTHNSENDIKNITFHDYIDNKRENEHNIIYAKNISSL